MSEIVDIVMPVLQRLQADMADLKRDVASVKETLNAHGEKLEDLEIHLAYLTGRESQNTFDLNKLRQRIKSPRIGSARWSRSPDATGLVSTEPPRQASPQDEAGGRALPVCRDGMILAQ